MACDAAEYSDDFGTMTGSSCELQIFKPRIGSHMSDWLTQTCDLATLRWAGLQGSTRYKF